MPDVALPPPTDTVTVVAVRSVAFPPSVAVTVTAVPEADSDTEAGDAESVIAVGTVSSSVSVTCALVTVKSAALPVTSMLSSPSARLSFAGISVKVPVPLALCAGIVTAKSETSA